MVWHFIFEILFDFICIFFKYIFVNCNWRLKIQKTSSSTLQFLGTFSFAPLKTNKEKAFQSAGRRYISNYLWIFRFLFNKKYFITYICFISTSMQNFKFLALKQFSYFWQLLAADNSCCQLPKYLAATKQLV